MNRREKERTPAGDRTNERNDIDQNEKKREAQRRLFCK